MGIQELLTAIDSRFTAENTGNYVELKTKLISNNYKPGSTNNKIYSKYDNTGSNLKLYFKENENAKEESFSHNLYGLVTLLNSKLFKDNAIIPILYYYPINTDIINSYASLKDINKSINENKDKEKLIRNDIDKTKKVIDLQYYETLIVVTLLIIFIVITSVLNINNKKQYIKYISPVIVILFIVTYIFNSLFINIEFFEDEYAEDKEMIKANYIYSSNISCSTGKQIATTNAITTANDDFNKIDDNTRDLQQTNSENDALLNALKNAEIQAELDVDNEIATNSGYTCNLKLTAIKNANDSNIIFSNLCKLDDTFTSYCIYAKKPVGYYNKCNCPSISINTYETFQNLDNTPTFQDIYDKCYDEEYTEVYSNTMIELEDTYHKDYLSIYNNYIYNNYNRIYYSKKDIQYDIYYYKIFNEKIITKCKSEWCKYKHIEPCPSCHLYGFYEFKNTIYENYNLYYNEINKEKLTTINSYYDFYNYKIDDYDLNKLITQYAILDLMNKFKKNNTDYSISTEFKNINNIEYIKEIDKKLKKEVKQNIDAYGLIKKSAKNTLDYYNDILLSSLYYRDIVYLLIYITILSILLNTVFIEFGYNKIFIGLYLFLFILGIFVYSYRYLIRVRTNPRNLYF
jgi:hypothetical protein